MLLFLSYILTAGLTVESLSPVDWQGNPAHIFAATYTKEGRIFFVNSLAGKIYSTNLKGETLPTIGQKGQGPGEFSWVDKIYYNAPFLYAYDSGRNKLHRIDPTSGTFLKDWDLKNVEALSISGNHLVASFRMPRQSHIFGTAIMNDQDIKFQHFMGGIPTSLQVSGAKVSTVLHASDGSLWMAYSGEFQLLHYSREGKLLNRIDDPLPNYVVPSQSKNISRFDTKAMSENVRKFDKMERLFEVKDKIVLYRPKTLDNSYLDIFNKQGKRLASYKIDHLNPVAVVDNVLVAFRESTNNESWDIMTARLHF